MAREGLRGGRSQREREPICATGWEEGVGGAEHQGGWARERAGGQRLQGVRPRLPHILQLATGRVVASAYPEWLEVEVERPGAEVTVREAGEQRAVECRGKPGRSKMPPEGASQARRFRRRLMKASAGCPASMEGLTSIRWPTREG